MQGGNLNSFLMNYVKKMSSVYLILLNISLLYLISDV